MELTWNFFWDRDFDNTYLCVGAWYNFEGVQFGMNVTILPKNSLAIDLALGVFGFNVALDWC